MARVRGSILFVVALVTAAACVGGGRPAEPHTVDGRATPFGSSGEALIAFHSDPAGSDDTYVMAPGRPPPDRRHRWRGDDRPAILVAGRDRMVVECCAAGPGTLYLLNGLGAEPLNLAPDVGEATAPAWSPDGSRIAFESVSSRSVYVVEVAGAEPGDPVELGAGARPSWSPDGSRIAYFAEVGRQHRHLLGRERRHGRHAPDRRSSARLLTALVARRGADRIRLRARRRPGHRRDGRRR